jgi:hypothetical protein
LFFLRIIRKKLPIHNIIDLLLKQEINNLFKAEFLRETGRFDDAIALIDLYTTEDINLIRFKEE